MSSKDPLIHACVRDLRRNPTPAEASLWQALRRNQIDGVHFRRQHPIDAYIVDFCAPRLKLIVEVDGSQHKDQQEYDQMRTADLERKGYKVLRFWNHQVLNDLEGVLQEIKSAIAGRKKSK
jgi:very-short-patch-repair endonuclease